MTDDLRFDPRQSLEPIFSPRSVAVIGASRDRDSIGFALLHNLVVREFCGTIFPVNPKARAIHSLKAYPDLESIPDPVDLAVVMVPRNIVLPVVDACLTKGVKGLVVITAGFAETGAEGAALELELRDKIRLGGARMIGPNCMGVINTDAGIRLDATFAPTTARPGSIGFVSQSGALGVAILNAAADLGIGFTQFVSVGNKAEVSANDLLEYWEHDPATRVICMYLESFGNPRRFTEIAKRVGRKKPILVVKSGRTAEGARAASSHTGAIAGTDVTVSAVLEQCGVLRANTIEDLFDTARVLDHCPLPLGNRVGIVSNAGGPAIMATDACVNLGLQIAELSDETQRRLASFLAPEASTVNPVDMIASSTPPDYARSLGVVLADDNVDMVIVIHVTPLLTNPTDVMHHIASGIGDHEKPVVAVMMAKESFYEEIKERTDRPPVYRFPESAARALAQLQRYSEWRLRPLDGAAPTFEADDQAVEEILSSVDEGYLAPDQAFRVLESYGIPVAGWRLVDDVSKVLPAAQEIGYPVVVKAVAPNLVHKSDVGAVKVDLRRPEELEGALHDIEHSLAGVGISGHGYLVQELVRGGHEVIFGVGTDPRFGTFLMFGLGGKYVEIVRDVRFGVMPLTPGEAGEMIRGIDGFALLEGVRGEPGADLERLEDVLLRIAQLAERHPRIQELDVNPFVAAPDLRAAKALDVRIRVGSSNT